MNTLFNIAQVLNGASIALALFNHNWHAAAGWVCASIYLYSANVGYEVTRAK